MKTLIACILVMMLAGCSTLASNQVAITFDSIPPGATISTPTMNFRVAPARMKWTLNKGQASAVSEPITATWISGAKSTITMNLQAGQEGTYVIVRPQGVTGLDQDIQWAIYLQQKQTGDDANTNAAGQMLLQLNSPKK